MKQSIKQDLVRFWDLIPGAFPLIFRLPAIFHSIKIRDAADDVCQSLGLFLEENAKRYPEKPAILYEDVKITHKAFNAAINRYANLFLSLGVRHGDIVGVFIENRPGFLFVVGALAKIGAISSLINTNHRGRVLAYSINLTKSRCFVIGEELVEAFEAIYSDLTSKGKELLFYVPDRNQRPMPDGYINLAQAVRNQPSDNPPSCARIQINDPISYIYTSGTTGLPKAAYIINRRWISCYYLFGKILMNLKSDDVLYCPLPLFHTTAFGVAWPAAAAGGAALAVRRKFSVTDFWNDINKYNATAFVYIGEICRYLLNQPYHPKESNNQIRKIVGNGLGSDIWIAFKNRFGIKQITEFYGAAEFGSCSANLFNIDRTVGIYFTPSAIVKYKLEKERPYRNSDGFMQRVNRGEIGLLIAKISKKVAFQGYTDKLSTKGKILCGVFKKGDMWFDTGDLVRDLGFKHIQFIDRIGDTFRWKGENVSTTEVEEALNALPQVSEAVVYGVRIPDTDGRAGMAGIIPAVNIRDFDSKALGEALNHTLPHYAVPKFIRLCKTFKTTSTFKIKKSVLQDEGFNPDNTKDRIFALLPGKQKYVPLTANLFNEINSGKFKY